MKHCNFFPAHAVRRCLKAHRLGLALDDNTHGVPCFRYHPADHEMLRASLVVQAYAHRSQRLLE